MKGTRAAEHALNTVSGRCKYVETVTSPSRPKREESIEFVFKGKEFAAEVTEEEGLRRWKVRNPRYAFSLTRGTRTKSYSLGWLAQYGANRKETETIDYEAAKGNALAFGAFCVYGRFVWDRARDPGFEITAISTSDTDEGERVRVEFRYTPADSETGPIKKIALENGYLVCDPSNHWRLCEYGRIAGLGGERIVLDCIPDREAVAPILLKHVSTRRTSAGELSKYRQEITCVESMFEDVSEEEFYLSHYGLPEPTFRGSWLGAWVWYLIAGIVCLVVSARILKRRRANA